MVSWVPPELFSFVPRVILGQTVCPECRCHRSSSHCVSFVEASWGKEFWSLPLRAIQCGRPLTSKLRAKGLGPETLAGTLTCKASGRLLAFEGKLLSCAVHGVTVPYAK